MKNLYSSWRPQIDLNMLHAAVVRVIIYFIRVRGNDAHSTEFLKLKQNGFQYKYSVFPIFAICKYFNYFFYEKNLNLCQRFYARLFFLSFYQGPINLIWSPWHTCYFRVPPDNNTCLIFFYLCNMRIEVIGVFRFLCVLPKF